MSSIYTQWKKIPEAELGDFNHVDHQNYIRWMREMTKQHYASMGFDSDYFIAKEHCFVVRRHSVEHLSPCFVGDRVLLATWISEVGSKALKRQHRIFKLDESGERIPVVRAQNLSIFVDSKVAPTSIPIEISGEFAVFTEDQASRHIRSLSEPPKLSQAS